MPQATSQSLSHVAEINRLQIRLTVAQNRRNPLRNTLNHLRIAHARKSAEVSTFRNQIRQAAREAQHAHSNNLVDEQRFKERLVIELNWQMSRAASEFHDLGGRIENVNQDVMELETEIAGIAGMLNLMTGGDF